MKSLQTYNQFLKQNFKDLEIKKPLFYNWEIGLRFDLQKVFKNPVSPKDKKYFKEVYKRALSVFEYCFDAEDEIIIVAYKFKWKKNKIKKSNFIFRQIMDFDSNRLYRDTIEKLYEPDDEDDIWHRALYRTKVNRVDYEKLVIGICNTDFPKLKPNIDEELFFLNLDKKLILNIYDDRGMDVIMTNKKTAKETYNQFSKWILEYDRDLIEKHLR